MTATRRISAAVLAASAALAIFMGGCAKNGTTSKPQPVSSAVPNRIVSLTPSNTEILFALGLGDKVVGDTKYCDYPAAAKSKPKIGDMDVSIEKVVSLKPDLVVADSLLNGKAVTRLKALDIPVVATNPKTIPEVEDNIKLIGKRTGTEARASEVADSIAEALKKAEKDSKAHSQVRTLVVIQVNPIWAAGPETFIDEMITASNGKNIAGDIKPGFNTFSTESAVSRNPQAIIVTRNEDKQVILTSPVWKDTDAVKRGHVVMMDPNILVRPGPRLADGIEQMSKAISEAAK